MPIPFSIVQCCSSGAVFRSGVVIALQGFIPLSTSTRRNSGDGGEVFGENEFVLRFGEGEDAGDRGVIVGDPVSLVCIGGCRPKRRAA